MKNVLVFPSKVQKKPNPSSGWGGVGGGGGCGAEGRVKHSKSGAVPSVSDINWYVQSTREAQTAVRTSLVPYAVLLMLPRTMTCTFVVLQHWKKTVCKSRPAWPSIAKYLVFLGSA